MLCIKWLACGCVGVDTYLHLIMYVRSGIITIKNTHPSHQVLLVVLVSEYTGLPPYLSMCRIAGDAELSNQPLSLLHVYMLLAGTKLLLLCMRVAECVRVYFKSSSSVSYSIQITKHIYYLCDHWIHHKQL